MSTNSLIYCSECGKPTNRDAAFSQCEPCVNKAVKRINIGKAAGAFIEYEISQDRAGSVDLAAIAKACDAYVQSLNMQSPSVQKESENEHVQSEIPVVDYHPDDAAIALIIRQHVNCSTLEGTALVSAIRPYLRTTEPELLNPDMPAGELWLHMGEMTDQEIRTARAAIRWANTRHHLAAMERACDAFNGAMAQQPVDWKATFKARWGETNGGCDEHSADFWFEEGWRARVPERESGDRAELRQTAVMLEKHADELFPIENGKRHFAGAMMLSAAESIFEFLGDRRDCPDCNGIGWDIAPGKTENHEPVQVPCPRCSMTGKINEIEGGES